MRAVLQADEKGRVLEYRTSGIGVQIGISEVLRKYGTEAMLALDRGETVHIITETYEEKLNDRPGS